MKNDMKKKFNDLWEQCIESQKRNVEHWLKENEPELVKLNRSILKSMQDEYKKVKIETS